MSRGRLRAEDILERARCVVAERIGPGAIVSGPRLVEGRWEVGVWMGEEGRWAEIARLRFDALGRLNPVPWPRVYERVAALLSADEHIRQTMPAGEPPVSVEEMAIAEIDPIAGLPSLSLWEMRVRREIARWHRFREPFSVAWSRLALTAADRARLGYRGLVALWRLAARRLAEAMRAEDFLAAAGAGEFAMVFVADAAGARRAAERLAERIARPFRLYHSGPTLRATLLVGIAEMRPGETLETLRENARQALRSLEKRSG